MTDKNWAVNRRVITDADHRMLERAKKYERQLIKKGWVWHRLNVNTLVLVPADKDGKPTKEALERLEKLML